MSSYLRLDEVAERAAGLEPVGLAEVLVELLYALIEGHVRDRFLVEDLEQIVQVLR